MDEQEIFSPHDYSFDGFVDGFDDDDFDDDDINEESFDYAVFDETDDD
jgi:hypothetical protein